METLSSRALPFIAGSSNPNSYGSIHISLLGDLYDKKSNPNGAILMSIAENKLCNELMVKRMQEHQQLPLSMMNYTDGTGVARLKAIMADTLSDVVFNLGAHGESEPIERVNPAQIVISTGCTGLLFQLGVLLFEAGDSMLIPTPYYPAFDQDFGFLGGVHRIPVHPSNLASYELTLADLDCAHATALERGQPPKAVLLTNPHNPLGKVYSPAELFLVVAWCREHRVHLICDEIYALSVFKNDNSLDGEFQSVAALLNNNLGDYVHILWGISKDLGGSGLRVGVLYSHNKALLTAVCGYNTANQVSNLVQEVLADTLADRDFLNSFRLENSARIRTSYQLLTAGLTRLGLPFYHAHAGIFLFADMRRLLREDSFEAETELHLALVDQARWSLTPGGACHHPTPGYFRLCYCWVDKDAIEECLRRLESFMSTWLGGSSLP